jgi:hypothetical protein
MRSNDMNEEVLAEDEEERSIRVGRLSLETLLLNLRGNEKVLVRNLDQDGVAVVGNEEEIRDSKGQWLSSVVWMIFYNAAESLMEVQIRTA